MKTLSIGIETTSLDHIRSEQTQIIRRAYVKAKKGLEFKTIHKLLQPTDLDGHLHRCGIQRGIDLAKIDNKTIFGGKKNFIRRCKGLITNAEWKALRIMPIYSIGQAINKGNRRFRIDYESRTLTYKDKDSNYQFNIPYLKPNWEIILKELCVKASNKEIALTFSVSDKQVNITYDETLLDCFKDKYKPYKHNKFRYLGIDLNPDRIGISIYDTRKLETKEMADSVAINWVGLYEEFKSRHLGWRSPPCSSRSSEYGAYGKRLLVHQKGVSV